MRQSSGLILTSIFAVTLTGCAWVKDWPPGTGGEPTSYDEYYYEDASYGARPEESKIVKTSEGTWLQPSNVVSSMDAAQKTGMKSAEMARIEKLETEFMKLRNDVEAIMPALRNMVQAQEDLRQAVEQISERDRLQQQAIAAQQQHYAQAPAKMPVHETANAVPAPASAQTQAQAQAQKNPHSNAIPLPERGKSGPIPLERERGPMPLNRPELQNRQPQPQLSQMQGAQMQGTAQARQQAEQQALQPAPASYVKTTAVISQIRFGEHKDKTRMVLDMTGQNTFQYDLDNSASTLRIYMPKTVWNTKQQMWLQNSPLISSYKAMNTDDGGAQLVLTLKRNVRVLMAETLPPAHGKGPRLVLDLTAG